MLVVLLDGVMFWLLWDGCKSSCGGDVMVIVVVIVVMAVVFSSTNATAGG